jgi:NAD(P)-dependent dehydrogenase (short-subunit alcohol dehydrogenase family)
MNGENMMPGRLDGLTAVVTGASRGIGLAIAREFAQQGAGLFLVARDPGRLNSVVDELGGARRVTAHACDLADLDALEAMWQSAESWATSRAGNPTGNVDILVNNAGIHLGRPFTAYTMDEFDRVMNTNVRSVFRLMQLAIEHMRPHGRGKIVNISSTAGRFESANQAVYNASKHALNGLTLCAALENAPHGININAICPGMVNTDMWESFVTEAASRGIDAGVLRKNVEARIPIGRFIEPEEVAHIAVWLASREADGMAGQLITISGGMRMG